MAQPSRKSLSRSAIAAYLCICVALVVLLGLTLWGSYRDTESLRSILLEAEVARLRSHARRTAERIEESLQRNGDDDLGELSGDAWLEEHWQRIMPDARQQSYAAVVNSQGEVVMHSEPSRNGQRLQRNWYDRVLLGVGDDVFETRSPALTLDELAYDVRVPIRIDDREVGEYHVGFDVDWFDRWMAEKQAGFVRRRSTVFGAVLLIVLLATTSLYYIAVHSIRLRRAVDSASIERASEVGKLAAGLAHEIRNPLHAIQLNLHTFRRAHEQQSGITPEEMSQMLEQSTREIDRIEHLMQQLVGFAAPDEPREQTLELTSELKNIIEFMQQEMLDRKIDVRLKLPEGPLRVQMDQGRLRQIMLNLLQNAQQALEDGGWIEVSLSRRRSGAEITVADNGSGVSAEDQTRVFEPFYSTKADGMGLGLALVKRYVDQLDGEIHCEANAAGGATFRIVLPAAMISNRRGT